MSAPQTLSAKILSSHGVADVTPGAFALARVDRVLINDVSGPVALREFDRIGAESVFDPSKVACVADHFWPAKDVTSARQVQILREFAAAQGIVDYWEVGATDAAGIEHTVLAEEGRIAPGDLVVGGDSHTCTAGAFGAFGTGMGSTDMAAALALGDVWLRVPETCKVTYHGVAGAHVTGKDLILALLRRIGVDGATYQALEFAGDPVAGLSVEGRMALCNMAVEAGAKTGLIDADETTFDWLRGRLPDERLQRFAADPDAAYEHTIDLDIDGMRPLVALPSSPGNVRSIDEVEPGRRVDQVYVGNCANGTLDDLRQLAEMIGGRHVAPGTRLIVVPASQRIYRQALAEGLIALIVEAGAMISPPTCGACFGGHMGILAAGETAVTTTNRNFRGRMGHRDSAVYLANAYVAGAAAVAGELVDPADIGGGRP